MIIVADSGSTKCDWALINGQKEVIKIRTLGINPRLISETEIHNIINFNKDLKLIKDKVKEVYFYGAGCASKKTQNSNHRYNRK